MNSKIASYFGFCVRSGKIAYGVDDIEKQKKSVFLIVIDEQLGASSTKAVLKAKEKFSCPLLVAKEGALAEALHKPAVKAAAIKDVHLAQAILSVMEDEPSLKIYGGND
ncbi:MAG: hypothetical protein E7367_02080 [Clostridiales bacterium]|nr:hypothetical protein [Clostridiales bacterium]MBQ8352835.1 hypothetical protein [Clostridia bacterium]